MVPDTSLNDGTAIRQPGFGTLPGPRPSRPPATVAAALAAGYRPIATAQARGAPAG
jgi:diketogulonate reductase-like aldo/keto reductase